MRILNITDNIEFNGGIKSYINNVTDLLRKNGYEVKIFSPPGSGENLASLFTRWLSYKYYSEVKEVIARFKPDIVHAHSLSMRISPLPLRAAKEKKIPVVMTVHDFNYVCPRKWMIFQGSDACQYGFGFRCIISNCPSLKTGWIYLPYHDLRWMKIAIHRRMLIKYVDLFITPSKVLGQWMRKSLGVDKVVHIPNFVQGKPYVGAADQNNAKLLFIGRLSKEKGVSCLLRAMPLVLATCPDASLTIIGGGPEKRSLEILSDKLNIKKKVCFKGVMENEKIGKYLEDSTVFVLPSLWMENCPVAGLEALSFGIPIIGSDIGGIPEIIRDVETGLLFRRDDYDDLADKICMLLKNRELLNEFRRRSIYFFKQQFSEDIHFYKISSLYKSLIK